MKIMFIPDSRHTNTYQTILASKLSKYGVSVYFDEGSVVRSVMKYRPDILHVHWPGPFMISDSKIKTAIRSSYFICGLSLLKLFGIKIVWTVHNIADHEGRSIKFFDKLFARLCDKLIAHCRTAKKEIENTYGERLPIEIIPHGSYIGQYKNTITYSEARKILNICDEDVVFLYFGQVRPYKGISRLIKTFKDLNSDKAKLLIVGKPLNQEIADEINNEADDNIMTVLRFIHDDDIQMYMNAADIVVLPYTDILTSGAAILAMSFGKPVIAPDIKCISDTIDDKGGFLYQNTEKGLFEAMLHVLNVSKEDLVTMGKHNLVLAEKLQWDEVARMTYNVYKDCYDSKIVMIVKLL